jgi:hypothetical protein
MIVERSFLLVKCTRADQNALSGKNGVGNLLRSGGLHPVP